MLEENSAVPGLQPAVGRLANALVAVLGPELTLGSPAYCSCRALIREMQVEGMMHHSFSQCSLALGKQTELDRAPRVCHRHALWGCQGRQSP